MTSFHMKAAVFHVEREGQLRAKSFHRLFGSFQGAAAVQVTAILERRISAPGPERVKTLLDFADSGSQQTNFGHSQTK